MNEDRGHENSCSFLQANMQLPCPAFPEGTIKKMSVNLAFDLLLCYIRYQYRLRKYFFIHTAGEELILKEEQA